MVLSKEWDWKLADKKLWTIPCEESYYYVNKWQQEGSRSVLDLGCGLGRHAILFAKHGFKVTAVDLSEEGIRYLRDWKQRENVDLLCKVCDMNQLPFADNAFDCIWAYHVISHTDFIGLQHIITEIKRVLKPEGQFFLTLCSKEAWAYKDARYEQIDSNTVIKTEGPEINVPHVYVDLNDIRSLFFEFSLNRIRHIEDCYVDGTKDKSKHYFIDGMLHKEVTEPDYSNIIGMTVSGQIDRPMGSYHPKIKDLYYPINYGYVDGVFAGDGAEQDVYLLGVDHAVEAFTGKVIAVYHRLNDNEDKWIVVPDELCFTEEEILRLIQFQEQYFDGKLYR